MSDQIAWVVSTAQWRPNLYETLIQVRVLCPICRLIHTHGGGSLDEPSLGGRSGHCGGAGRHSKQVGYDLAWPDDAGAQLLTEHIGHCHMLTTRGTRCARRVAATRGVGFYCDSHSYTGIPLERWDDSAEFAQENFDRRVTPDTSELTASHRESVFTPKFQILDSGPDHYRRLNPDEVAEWEARWLVPA